MAHPKSRISKQRKRKRRTHKKLKEPQIALCNETGEVYRYHHAYWHEGKMYYKGRVVIDIEEEIEE